MWDTHRGLDQERPCSVLRAELRLTLLEMLVSGKSAENSELRLPPFSCFAERMAPTRRTPKSRHVVPTRKAQLSPVELRNMSAVISEALGSAPGRIGKAMAMIAVAPAIPTIAV